MRGRVMALYGIVFLGTTPIASPVAGWVGEHLGPRIALAGGGIVALATGLLGLWVLSLRRGGEAVPADAARAEVAEALTS
jgi:hypothetical protein